ncbi:MAG: hypothetical protein WCS73_03625 [Lentisphaeria bacterium]
MRFGFFLSILLGCLWAAVGVTVALARNKNCPIWHFYTVGAGGGAFLCWLFWCFTPSGASAIPQLLVFMGCAAFFNALGQALTMYNLKASGRSLAFTLPQINFVFPFLYAALFMNGVINFLNVSGFVLITVAILCSCKSAKKDSLESQSLLSLRELFLGGSAAVIIGIGQIFLLYAATIKNDAPPILKAALILTVSAIVYGIGACIDHKHSLALKLHAMHYGFFWSVAAMLSYYVLLRALSVMGPFNRSGIVFALAGSITIVIFWLFSFLKMHDKISRRQMIVLSLILGGIVAIRLG